MNIEDFRNFCIKKPGVKEEFPFGPETLVFKVGGKIFALTGLDNSDFSVNLKCDPDYAEELREKHTEVQPGYHMNKKHWNTVFAHQDLPLSEIKKLIDHSYELIFSQLGKKVQEEIGKEQKL